MTLRAITATASVLVAALRVGGERGEFFQGVAHVWVGGLFGHAWGGRSRYSLAWALALTAVEIACFVTARLK